MEEYRINLTKRNVSLVVLPIDSFLGRAADGQKVRVRVGNERNLPVIKQDGHHVFVNLSEESRKVRVESEIFFPEWVMSDRREKGDENSILKIRLIPNRRYELPPGTDLYTGQIDPYTDVFARTEEGETGIKLMLYKEEEGCGYMQIYASYAVDPVHKEFALVDENGETERFCVEKKTKDGLYLLWTPLKGNWRRGQTLYPVYRGRSDETGYLFLPLKGITREKVIIWH